jgi:uncharacterized membrane protein YhaH (DUF805 family)
MKRLVHHTKAGLRRTLDLQGRAARPEYGFLVLGSAVLVALAVLIWAVLGFWAWPLIIVNLWTLVACATAGIRRLRDAGQHVGWAIAHGTSLLLLVAAYALLLADIDIPKPEMKPGFSGVIAFVLLLIFTVASVALLQVLMLVPIAVFVITTPVMVYLVRQPSRSPELPGISLFGWLPWKH